MCDMLSGVKELDTLDGISGLQAQLVELIILSAVYRCVRSRRQVFCVLRFSYASYVKCVEGQASKGFLKCITIASSSCGSLSSSKGPACAGEASPRVGIAVHILVSAQQMRVPAGLSEARPFHQPLTSKKLVVTATCIQNIRAHGTQPGFWKQGSSSTQYPPAQVMLAVLDNCSS